VHLGFTQQLKLSVEMTLTQYFCLNLQLPHERTSINFTFVETASTYHSKKMQIIMQSLTAHLNCTVPVIFFYTIVQLSF